MTLATSIPVIRVYRRRYRCPRCGRWATAYTDRADCAPFEPCGECRLRDLAIEERRVNAEAFRSARLMAVVRRFRPDILAERIDR